MQISIILLRQLIMFFIMIIMGYMLVKSKLLKSEDSKVLSVTLIYLVLPCVIVNAFQITITKRVLQGITAAFIAAVAIHLFFILFIWVGGKLWNMNEIEKAVVMYSNAGNMIIPIVGALLGQEWVLYSSAYIAVQLIFMWTHGSSLLDDRGSFQLRKIVTNINIIAIVIGIILFFTGIKLPLIVTDTMSSVGDLLAPMSMFTTGMIIAGVDLKQALRRKRIYFIDALRLLITPVIILLLIYVSGIAGRISDGNKILLITFLAVLTPSSSTITQMAQIYNKDSEYAGILNVTSTIACIITMPVLVWIYCCLFPF